MAYLGFRKGGPNFRWPLVLIQRRGPTKFSNFFNVKIFFWPKGAMAQCPPPKYASEFFHNNTRITILHVYLTTTRYTALSHKYSILVIPSSGACITGCPTTVHTPMTPWLSKQIQISLVVTSESITCYPKVNPSFTLSP